MDAEAAQVEACCVPIRRCPKKAPCPGCGKLGRRKQVLRRKVRTIAYKQVVYWDVIYAEYRARCDCCRTFRVTPDGIDLRWHYDNKVREAVLDRILQDGMSIQRVVAALQRDFLLNLSEGFVYDCLRAEVGRLNMGEYRRWTLENFSGTLCVDELHLGQYTLLLATDPLNDFPVAFALVGRNDGDHMRRFLGNLKNHGLRPAVVVTDGSNLYPSLIEQLWSSARHQLCVFHVIKDQNKLVLDAVKRMRRAMSRRGKRGRRRKRGRPTKAQQRQRKQRAKSVKEKAYFVFKHRYLIVKRHENVTKQERKTVKTMLGYLPELKTLRTFADRVYKLFELNQSEHQAWCRRAALLRNEDFQKIPELVQAMKMLEQEKFAKMIAFLQSPTAARTRTNNHVERANRKLRYYEKVRYKWRRRRMIVRFLILALNRWQRDHSSAKSPQGGRETSSESKPFTNKSDRQRRNAA